MSQSFPQQIPKLIPESENRLYYLDWLRIFAVILLFFFHTARIFDVGEANYIENPESSGIITIIFVWVINIFHMPLFFTISGASTNLSIEKRGIKQYSIERIIKLLIPLLFGFLVVVPPQTFYAAKFHNGYAGSYLNWLFFDYFQTGFSDITGYRGTLTPAHLWFLFALLIVSFLALPLIYLLRRKNKRGLNSLYNFTNKRPFMGLLVIPAVILTAVSALPMEIAGKNLVYYLVSFLLGYALVGYENFLPLMQKIRKYLLLIIGLAVGGFIIYNCLAFYTDKWNSTINFFLWGIEESLVMWSIILVLFSIFMEKLNRTNAMHRYASSAAFPVYIQHQTWLYVIAYYIVPLSIPLGWKYLLVLLGGFVLSLIGFEIIKRINFLRIMFGIKWKKSLHMKKRNVNSSYE